MTAAARPSSRRDKAERRLPTEAADLTPGPGGPRHLGIVGEDLVGFRFAGCAFRSCSAPRGHVALEAASALGGETGAEHALRLCAQELGPAGADPARCRPEAGDAQHGRDRGRGDVDSELQQLALDAHIAQRGLSRASRRIRLRVAGTSGGRPRRARRRYTAVTRLRPNGEPAVPACGNENETGDCGATGVCRHRRRVRDRLLCTRDLGRRRRFRTRLRTSAVVPLQERHEDDGCSAADQSCEPPSEARQRASRLRRRWGRGPARLEPRVQLRDIDVAIEAEELGVGAEEPSRVHLGGSSPSRSSSSAARNLTRIRVASAASRSSNPWRVRASRSVLPSWNIGPAGRG
jgi:hypothetical protein